MKMSMLAGALALALVVGCASTGTQFNDLPVAVQNTIRTRAPNAQIADIDKETRSGRTVYEVTFEQPGMNPKMHIAADGTILD